MSEIRIGISGWTYAPWRGIFFPRDLPQHLELFHASRQVSSIEINGTFYSLQRPSSYRKWYEQTPENFIFSVKAPRFITHIKRLNNVAAPLANFLASGVLRLNEKLGPVLWQLPPSFKFEPDRLAEFFALLPRDTKAAAALAERHDHHLVEPAWTKIDRNRPLRHAIEIRHESFRTGAFVSLLRRYNIALVVADTAGKWPLMEDVTSDFVYVRLHGDEELYVSGYTPSALKRWSRKIQAWSTGRDAPNAKLSADRAPPRASRDVFAYFDNDVKTHAPFDAMSLAHLLGLAPPPPAMPVIPLSSVTKLRNDADDTPRPHWPGFGTRASRRQTKQKIAHGKRAA